MWVQAGARSTSPSAPESAGKVLPENPSVGQDAQMRSLILEVRASQQQLAARASRLTEEAVAVAAVMEVRLSELMMKGNSML